MSGSRILTISDWRAQHLAGTPPKILSDPEVRAFVDERLPRCTFVEIARQALERFGRQRAPSKSAVARYWRLVTHPDKPEVGMQRGRGPE